jgi:hypothetical protein
MTVTVKHSKTNAISDWTQAQLDEQIELGNFAPGTTLADIVLPSDWNNDHTLTGVGTMAEQDADTVAITGGTATLSSVTTPSVTATTNNLTLSAISTGKINLNTATANQVQITDSAVSAGQYTLLSRDNSGNEQRVSAAASSGGVNLGLSSAVAGAVKFYTNSFAELQMQVSRTASAVNYVQVTGAATTSFPIISAQGSDTNISLQLYAKGTGAINFWTNNGGTRQLQIANATSSVNYATVSGSATTNAIPFSVAGTDTNISMAFQPKGTGAINLAAGSSGVNISNGGTVTAITRTAGGSGYATAPTVTISPPTTAGGVQATATCTITAGSVNTTFTITNAGSGYIEQPTITFSGGGGSGAAAYATVGSGTIVRSLGTNIQFFTPGGLQLNVTDTAATAANYVQIQGRATGNGTIISSQGSDASINFEVQAKGTGGAVRFFAGSAEQVRFTPTASAVNYVQVTGATTLNPPVISAQGSDTTVALLFQAKGGQNIRFFSNAGSAEQFRILHTGGTIANYCSVTGNVAGSAPAFSVNGSDTNIDLALTPKGTGLVRFGTYVAGALTATGYINIKAADGTTYKVLVST